MRVACGLAVVPGGLAADLVDPPVAGRRDDPAGGAGRQARPRASAGAPPRRRPGPLPRRGRCRRRSGPGSPPLVRTRSGRPARSRTCPLRARGRSASGSAWNGRTSTVPLAGLRRLGGQRQGGVEVRGLDDPEATDVLLGLEERAVGDVTSRPGVVDDGGRARAARARRRTPSGRRSVILSLKASTALNAACMSPRAGVSDSLLGAVDGEQVLGHGGLLLVRGPASVPGSPSYTNGSRADRQDRGKTVTPPAYRRNMSTTGERCG